MKPRLIFISLLGLALAAYLVAQTGFTAVFSAMLAVGWGGFLIICLYGLLLFAPLGAAWHALVPRANWRDIPRFVWARAVRDSATEVLPFSQVGGFVVGARALILSGTPMQMAFASTIVDVTTELMAQIAYVAFGVCILIFLLPKSATMDPLTFGLVAGLAVAFVAGALFILVQRRGLRFLAGKVSHWLPRAVAHAETVTAAIGEIYDDRTSIGKSLALHFSGWIGTALGSWIALRLLGAPIGILPVMALESVVYGMRSAAFAMPSGFGVQEATYAFLSPLLGVPPEIGLALSLLKRARDIVIGVPLLLAWQGVEGRRLLAAENAPGGSKGAAAKN